MDYSSNSPLSDKCGSEQIIEPVIDEVAPEEIQASIFDNSPIWRSAAVVAPAPAPHSFESCLEIAGTDNAKGKSPTSRPSGLAVCNLAPPSHPVVAPNGSPLLLPTNDVPETPIVLMTTHFRVSLLVNECISKVESFLQSMNGISFDFQPHAFHWIVFYLSGSCHCKVQLSIYSEGFSEELLLELNRLQGDSQLFRSLYLQMKSDLFFQPVQGSSYDPFNVFTPLPNPPCVTSTCTDKTWLDPIFRMARSPNSEAQLEGARALCDLTADEDMRSHLADLGCVDVLLDLFEGSHSFWTQQHAVVALANLSDCTVSLSRMLNRAIPALLQTISCKRFEYSEARILSTYILAQLCIYFAADVVCVASSPVLQSWIQEATRAENERVKLHAERAREALQLVL